MTAVFPQHPRPWTLEEALALPEDSEAACSVDGVWRIDQPFSAEVDLTGRP